MKLIENVDYYVNEQGKFVFTASYLEKRGFCCNNGCLNCPYKESTKVQKDNFIRKEYYDKLNKK